MEIQYENKEICKRCGFCCKKCGCDYASSDFENLSYECLCNLLMEGNISIVSFFTFKEMPNGKIATISFLYLRARNNNRPIIDLLSMKTECSQLGPNGCKYDLKNRPSGGINLIPMKNKKCYSLKNPQEIVETWNPYQNVLSRIVKRISGHSVYKQLSIDIENLFYDVLCQNFYKVENMEIIDIMRMFPLLATAHVEEYSRAKERFAANTKIKLKVKEK